MSDTIFTNTSGQTLTVSVSGTLSDYHRSGDFLHSDLASVVIGTSVTSIGSYAFQGCLVLTQVTIPDTVTSIGDAAFQNCPLLASITIPSSVTTISSSGFNNSHHIVVTMDTQTISENVYTSPATGVSFFGSTNTDFVRRTPLPITCFPAGTPIQTDQGVTAIDKLVPGEHTLRGKNIIAITQTSPLQQHIVCFEKDSIAKNVPSQQTLCSKEHKVLYQGEMIKARDLADMCKNVKKVSYNGEGLYNVLLEKQGKMLVNNMICETLHPENISAKFAKSKNTSKKNVLLN